MKKVLIISYYFPPSGGPGVQRVLKFVKYLPEFGWEPVVLTVKDGDFPARDESLLTEIPKNIRVYRTEIFEPYDFYRKLTGRKKGQAIDVDNIEKASKKQFSDKIAEFIRATFFIPDARKGWKKFAVKEGKKIIDTEKPDLIFSSSPPYTCALIAMELKRYVEKKYGKKMVWVSDFRDAWTDYLTTPNRWFLPKKIDKHYEKTTLNEADVLTIVASGMKDDFDRKYPEISKKTKYVLIRNGFDSEDYISVNFENKKNEKFTVVYTGSMYGKRNPYYFLDSIAELVENGKVDNNKIKFIFVGRMGRDIQKYINNSPLKSTIELISYVPHSESINYLIKADAMLLLIDEDKYSKMILSGKVFEYLGTALITKKPIFAITGEGEAKDLIEETKSGVVIPHHKPEILAIEYLKLYNGFFENKNTFLLDSEAIKKYDRKHLTEKLARVFNESLVN
ncbi:MAG: glycosyltransferase family 4 protein [Chlorobi bacterium]|nr:glycosyltransferase family 4 protein [Chlorobiota bacterium]MCI0714807.1 glycosyltransferase family 4 protein [Chlorobiota bacterium]